MRIPTPNSNVHSDDECMPAECIWMFIETKHMLMARNQIFHGTVMTEHPIGADDLVQHSLSSTFSLPLSQSSIFSDTGSQALGVPYLHVRRSDMLLALDEMLRERGGYGPDIVQDVLASIDMLPPVNGGKSTSFSVGSISVASSWTIQGDIDVDDRAHEVIDAELALESAFLQMMKRIIRIRDIESHIFGKNALPNVVERSQAHKKDGNAYNSENLLHQLVKLKEFLVACIVSDHQRTGSVPTTTLKSVLYSIGQSVLKESQEWRLDELLTQCGNRFRDSLDQSVNYIDIFAVLLAGSIQNDGEYEFNTQTFSYFIHEVKRGLDTDVATLVMELLSCVQCPVRTDCLWTAFHSTFDYKAHVRTMQQDALFNQNVREDVAVKGKETLSGNTSKAMYSSTPINFSFLANVCIHLNSIRFAKGRDVESSLCICGIK